MSNTLTHSGTAILINDGQTAYVYDHGYYVDEILATTNVSIQHVELEDSYRAVAKACEFSEDGSIYIFNSGRFIPYAKNITTEYLDDSWISDWIFQHECIGECTLEEWEQFSDIYKDIRGIRPIFGSYKFHII